MTTTKPLAEHWEWEHRKNIPDKVVHEVLERDNNQCQLCGTGGENRLQLHHWYSFRSQGGPHCQENLVTLCFICHEKVHAGKTDVMVTQVAPGVWRAFPATPQGRNREVSRHDS